MKKYFSFGVLIVMIIILLVGGVTLTQAQQTGDSISSINVNSAIAKMPWHSEYVQYVSNPDDVGEYASLALRPVDDLPYISYYDKANGNLMLAYYAKNGGGNCGTNNNWHCDVLDGDGGDNVGTYTSLEFWYNKIDTYKIGISYHDATNGALKYISWSCTELTCTIPNKVTIATPGLPILDLGLYTSLKFAPDGTPHIAYHTINTISGTGNLIYASYVASGGNCGEGSAAGKWNCTTIDSGPGIGKYASLDLTYDGSPYIAYYDAGSGDLKMAYYTGIADPHCNDDNGWMCPVLDSGGVVGLYPSLTAQRTPDDQLYRIAYYDATNEQLKYTDETWEPLNVDFMGSSTSAFMGISMDVDKDDNPIIAYQQVQAGDYSRPTLNITRPYFVYDEFIFGNCGDTPPGYLFTYWRCNILDNAGQYVWEADIASVVVKSSGLAAVAYSEYDEYYDATSLKYITQRFQTLLPLLNK